jgi:hypothetical protein
MTNFPVFNANWVFVGFALLHDKPAIGILEQKRMSAIEMRTRGEDRLFRVNWIATKKGFGE